MVGSDSGTRGAWARSALALTLLLAPACLYLILPPPASAHAKLARSSPKSNESLAQPPQLVELWFTEGLNEGFNTIEVKDQQGRRVDRGEVALAEGGKKAQVELEELGAGAYTVNWKVVSEDDHTIRGKFTFKVTAPAAGGAAVSAGADPSGTAPPSTGQPAVVMPEPEVAAGDAEETPITWVDSVIRWLSYLAMMTLFGSFATRPLVIGQALRDARGEDEARGEKAAAAANRRTITLLRASLVLLFPMLVASLVFQASAAGGVGTWEALTTPSLLGSVLTRTGFGSAWLVAVLAAAALAVLVFYLARAIKLLPSGDHTPWWWAGLAGSAWLLVAPSLTGHAMAAAGEHHFAVVSDWLHLAGSGFWVGGLFHLALAMPPALAQLAPAQRTHALGRVIKLFTRVAIPSVVVLSLAGFYNSWIHLGSFGALWSTSYGRTLLVKLLLILPMLALGALNGFRFGPRAGRLAVAGGDDDATRAGLERDFTRSVKIEAALGALVLLVAAFLVFVTPSRNDAMKMTAASPPGREGRGAVEK